MKIGVLGGTFDPPHVGHLRLAKAALDSLSLDLVLWIPNAQNPLKKDSPTAEDATRLEMVQLMIADEPQMAVSDIEITREGPSYMWETLDELKASHLGADFWLLLGADNLESFMRWHYPERILKIARLGVAVRPGVNRFRLMGVQAEPVQRRIDLIEMAPTDASSTAIREQLAFDEPTEHLAPAVRRYIEDHGLYQKDPRHDHV